MLRHVIGEILDAVSVHVSLGVVTPVLVLQKIVFAIARIKGIIMGTWSSGIGKFVKKDPNHGSLWRKIKHWFCTVGLCNLDTCKCHCHEKKCCDNGNCKCSKS